MDARREPRFTIYGPVKATLLANPDRTLDCVLLDISATGLKLIASENLPLDDILAIEADDHLALAEVRYTQPRGDKFTIGCERIHVINKLSLPDDKLQIDRIRLLVDDYRKRLSDGLATPRPDAIPAEAARLDRQLSDRAGSEPPPAPTPQPQPLPGAFATRDQLLDAAAAWVVEHWDKIPSTPHDAQAGRSEIVDRLTIHLAEKLRPPVATPQPSEPHETPKKKPAPPKEKKKVRAWRIPIGLAAAAVLGWGLSALFWSLGSTGAASRLPPSIAALVSPKETPAPAPVSSVRHVQIKVVEPTWIVATSDGKRLFNKKLVKDDTREIDFSDKALLRIGNAKGVEITLDGKPIGPVGGRGQPRMVELSASGFRLLPLN